jgi:hypothetical protein
MSAESAQKVKGVWSGYVRYKTAPAETRLGWFERTCVSGPVMPLPVLRRPV